MTLTLRTYATPATLMATVNDTCLQGVVAVAAPWLYTVKAAAKLGSANCALLHPVIMQSFEGRQAANRLMCICICVPDAQVLCIDHTYAKRCLTYAFMLAMTSDGKRLASAAHRLPPWTSFVVGDGSYMYCIM